MKETFIDIFRSVLGWIDSIIYNFISSVYETFINIANYTFINNDIITEFSERVYVLLGVFMLFRLAFSFVNYFINPDNMGDKKNGVGNLVQRVIISLVLLVLTPTFFNLAFKIQVYVVKENVLANLILGGKYENFSIQQRQQMYSNAGKHMAFATLKAFMHPENKELLQLTNEELDNKYGNDKDLVKYIKEYKQAEIDGNIDALVGWYKLNTKEDTNGNYIFSYSAVLSTIAGLLVVWILVVFCIDIGVRTVKLAFLQLIAPIPIIGYIDNDRGDKVFKTWYGTCFATYLELFLKLTAIYFVIFVISLISSQGIYEYTIDGNGDLVTQSVSNPDFFVNLFIILGLLIFANEVPNLIGEMFGIKGDGFSLNPMKRIGKSALATGFVGGVTGGLFGSGLSAYGNYKTNRDMGQGRFKSLMSGAGGVFTGFGKGASSGMRQKKISNMIGSGSKAASSSAAKILERPNTTFWGRNLAAFQNKVGLQTAGDLYEKRLKSYNDVTRHLSTLKTAAGKRLDKNPDYNINIKTKDKNGNDIMEKINIAEQRAKVEALGNVDVGKMDANQKAAHYKELAEAKSKLATAENEAKKAIMKEMHNDFIHNNLSSVDDAEAIAALDGIQQNINDEPTWYKGLEYVDKDGNKKIFTANMQDSNFLDEIAPAVSQSASEISTSKGYKTATANADYAKRSSGSSSSKK